MAHVTQCSIDGEYASCTNMHSMTVACPQLRQLQLRDVGVQLGRSDGCPGVLQDCTGLTRLGLQDCTVHDGPAASEVLEALPDLQHLDLANDLVEGGMCHLAELWKLSKL